MESRYTKDSDDMLEETLNFEAMLDNMKTYTVILPEKYRETKYEGTLYGYYIKESKTFNVVTDNLVKSRSDVKVIGEAFRKKEEAEEKAGIPHGICLVWEENDPTIMVINQPDAEIILNYYSLQKEVFSRNQGILESNKMKEKQAVIAGVGSGGFFVGLELVKAGIGSLVVADDDCFAYHNICRHVCGIHDVGKYKVDCFRERAADINPDCRIYTFKELLQHIDPAALDEVIWENSIILCCTDNRHAGYVCNELADKYHIPMVDAGCGPRASTGEVFYYKPDCGMACYTCAYGEDIGVDHNNQAVRRKFYATESELEKLHFQPGLSLDIEQTAIFEVKLAIDLLMERDEEYEPKLLPYVNQCTILLNYAVDKEVNPYMRLFENETNGMRPFTWKTGTAQKNQECSYCKTIE